MKRIILTSGPRGAGKTKYIDNFLKNNPKIKLLSRDKLLMDLFGQTSLNPYEGGQEYATGLFFKNINENLKKYKDIDLIGDCWNGFPSERQSMVERFRNYGADRIICWKFMTPLDVCIDWFMRKEDVQGYSVDSCKSDYALYHEKSANIEEDGFDQVYLTNPLQLELFN